MGLSDDSDEQRFEELCLDLNMDKNAKDEAAQAFERMRRNYTLEGNTLHWLACALYVSGRRNVPTVDGRVAPGNYVSLTRLLRSGKLSLIEFFKKIKKWADMANLPQEFRDRIDRLERNFAVSTVIFKKYRPIFMDIFRNPADCPVRPPRGRKQRRLPCSAEEVFKFCWTMFVMVKGNFPALSDDLVNSYHLLLCCIDWFYTNSLMSNRRDLLNPEFSGLPQKFNDRDYKSPTDVPCVVQLLCDKYEGLVIEAKGIKEHWWKPYIRKLFRREILKGKSENLTGVLDIGNFEANSKTVSHEYEEYVLNRGDFDERIFLGVDANTEIGTPAKLCPAMAGDLTEKIQVSKNLWQSYDETRSLAPSTPLTGRHYLKDREAPITPVSTATQSVSRLHSLLSGRKTCPSETLVEIFNECTRNPKDEILKRVKDMGEVFCRKYVTQSDDRSASLADFARKRLQLAECLLYKVLENILQSEKRRLRPRDGKPPDLSNLLEQDIFHRSLFSCCLEIVIFSYNSQRMFPWIIDVFDISPFYFYKVIEILIRAEDSLSRDVVKHLNHIEETILESYAWKSDSVLWDCMKQQNCVIPSVEEVSLPNQIEKEGAVPPLQVTSPPMHPAVRRIAGGTKELLQSPAGPSLVERFNSPVVGSAKRKLFGSGPAVTSSENRTTSLVTLQAAVMENGQQVLIPVQMMSAATATSSITMATAQSTKTASVTTSVLSSAGQPVKPKKTGSLALFYRKVYHLASVRLRDLCERLDIDSELRSKMWTCFEHCMIHHVNLMQDRHLDQLIMCAIYVIAKVTDKDQSFQDIMKCYRMQPQAQSHVYRSVLLNSRQRRSSGSSESSKNGASGSSSPVVVAEKDREDRDKRRMDRLSLIRSSSALPVAEPDSQPPTPTRLAGTGSSFEFEDRGEDRGDLIKFYNAVYVKRIKNFALKFAQNGAGVPILSPLPVVQPHQQSPRRVSSKHSVYVSPHKGMTQIITPQTKMLYCFNRSPAKDLRAINIMLRKNDRTYISGKRLALADEGVQESPVKRFCPKASPAVHKRLEEVLCDRQAANGAR